MTKHIVSQRPAALIPPEVYTGRPGEGPGTALPDRQPTLDELRELARVFG